VEVLVDGPSEDPPSPSRAARPDGAGIDGVVYLRDVPSASAPFPREWRAKAGAPSSLHPGHFARVRIVEAGGHELIGERA
jgi:hypothetical protein